MSNKDKKIRFAINKAKTVKSGMEFDLQLRRIAKRYSVPYSYVCRLINC
jgi:hypothetical protein